MARASVVVLCVSMVLAARVPVAHAGRCEPAVALETVRALCAALDGGSDAEVRARVRLPLAVRRIVGEAAGNPRFARTRHATVRSLRKARVCDGAELAAARVTSEDAEQRVEAPRGQFSVVFSLVAGRGGCVVFRLDDR